MLNLLLYQDATVKDMLSCSSIWSEANLFICQQLLLSGADVALHYFQHDIAWVANKAHGSVVLELAVCCFIFWGEGV